MDELITKYADYIAIGLAVITVANRIAKLTPSESDNKVVEWIYKIFAVIGLKVQDNPGKTDK